MSAESIGLVIFDLDGTLTDSLRAIAVTRTRLARALVEITGKTDFVARALAAILRADIHETEIVPRLITMLGARTLDGALLARLHGADAAFRAAIHQHARLLPSALTCLERLRALRVGCVVWTNKRARFAGAQAEALGLTALVDRLYCRADDADIGAARTGDFLVALEPARRKPSRESLRAIVLAARARPERTLLVGNNRHNDGAATLGGQVRFVEAAYAQPSAAVEASLFRLTGDARVSYRAVRHHAHANEQARPAAVLNAGLNELFARFEFAP